MEGLLQQRRARVAVKVGLAVLGTALSLAFFGFCVPFFALAFKLAPSLGVGGVVYFLAGGLFGLLFGGVSLSVSLARSPQLVTPYSRNLVLTLLALCVAFAVVWATMTERFSHV